MSDVEKYISAFFQGRTGASIAAHRADADLFDQPPNRLLDDGEEIVPGLRVVHLAHGKSPGEIALYWPALKLVLAGDLVVGAPLGRITLLPDAKLADPPRLPWACANCCSSILTLC